MVPCVIHYGGEVEAAGHITSTVRNRELCVLLLLDFPVLCSPGSLVQGVVLPTVKMSLPTPVNLIQMVCHRCAQRLISRVILGYVEMIVEWSL